MDYNFKEIESKWQSYWAANQTFKAEIDNSKPKYYVLDMFPYPSGAGLHVGHPLGYIASDIYSRDYGEEYRTLSRADGQNRFFIRLVTRGEDMRSWLLQVDTVGIPPDVRQLV